MNRARSYSFSAAERRAAIDRLRQEEAAELAAMDAAHRQSVGQARRGGRQRVREAQRLRSRALTSRQRHERLHLALLLKSIGAVRRARRALEHALALAKDETTRAEYRTALKTLQDTGQLQ